MRRAGIRWLSTTTNPDWPSRMICSNASSPLKQRRKKSLHHFRRPGLCYFL